MQKFYKPLRISMVFVVVGLILVVYMTTLYRLQLFDAGADANAYLARDRTEKKVTLTANRGDILDRNGVKLVTSRAAYNVTLTRKTLIAQPDVNKIILDLIHTAVDNGVAYTDMFPVTSGAPFSYVLNMSTTQKNRLKEYLKFQDYFHLGKDLSDISASDLIIKLKEHYKIDYTMNISDARLVIGVRYEMELRAIIDSMNPYIFASDVGLDFIMLLNEKHYPGVNIETTSERIFHTTYAAHILGHIGSMDQSDYDNVYKKLGYSYNSVIGKDGAEAAFETYLHGVDGEQSITSSADGTVLNVDTTKQPAPGNNIFMSIDIGLQAAVEDSIAARINILNADRVDKDRVTGGAAVVTDVNTGDVLACASYPTFNPATFLTNYSDLSVNPAHPLFNRATMGSSYNPGSTFKMITALAGLKNGAITPTTQINCTGIFMKYAEQVFTPVCWIYGESGVGHGPENVVTAIRDSCDYFFYQLSDTITISPISATAADFGFGSRTGIELPDKAGTLPTEKNKLRLIGTPWYAANTILSAIGQDIVYTTPIQLANYTATIANGGTLYKLTMLQSIRSADFSTVLYQPQPTPLKTVQGSDWLPYIQDGMKQAAVKGTAKETFKGFRIPVACKTGTVQYEKSMGHELINNGVFVCYAPADNPQIAISVVVEKGTSGATIANIAKDILDYYYRIKPDVRVAMDNQLHP